jgi:hypothetical protein
MSLSWEGMFAYAFLPFRFIAPVLHKITGEKCRIIVIAPAWPKQAWFEIADLYLFTVEGARPFTSKRKTRKSVNCWTEILNGSISSQL